MITDSDKALIERWHETEDPREKALVAWRIFFGRWRFLHLAYWRRLAS